jgi:adenosylcobinamide-phosphate synthase
MEIFIFIIIVLAVCIDIVLGELPNYIHPVVWMGYLINFLKTYLINLKSRWSGVILTSILLISFILPLLILVYYIKFNYIIYILFSSIILSSTFSIKLLISSARDINILLINDPEKARRNVSYLVSRNTENLNHSQLISATVESLTENITDSIVAPILFAFILGLPGAMFYRVINTLDAMVGYKNHENIIIGWFPAKLDDLLNYIPARVTGLIIVISAFILRMNWKNSFKIMIKHARIPPSPNSGYPMAASAGALEIKLEKPNVYTIGVTKKNLDILTIEKAIKLTKMTILIFLLSSTLFFSLLYYVLYILSSYF